MKHIKSTPKDTRFFAVYARLARAVRRSGWAAQLVSALTEIGGIYAAAYAALVPILPAYAMYLAALIATIGTAVIEFGLRILAPHTVDAILYKRFQGLHLAMTIAIWIMTAVLFTTSGILSFRNSHAVIEEVTPEAEQKQTEKQDSLRVQLVAAGNKEWLSDSTHTITQTLAQVKAEKQVFDMKIKAAKRKLSNLYNREKRTEKSYATAKDRVRQEIADLEAEKAAALASLQLQQSKLLSEARERRKERTAAADNRHQAAVDSIVLLNQASLLSRDRTVDTYGSGLAWFTIVSLFVFAASILLDRIHRKGSGIEETVDLSQYDISPSALIEAWTALRERAQYSIRNQIKAFAEKTPPAPLPSSPSELYDPTQIANSTIDLKISERPEADNPVIYIEPKRRKIGFKNTPRQDGSSSPLYVENIHAEANPHYVKHTPEGIIEIPVTHENSYAVKGIRKQDEQKSLSDLFQRLKDYKKRLGKHEQKKLAAERAGKAVPKRTLNAIANNASWVKYYEDLIEHKREK